MRGQLTLRRKQGRWASSVSERVTWLLEHPEQWKDWAGERDPRRRALVEALRTAGLIAKTTYWKDVRVVALILLATRTNERITKNVQHRSQNGS